jgi:photosystem II stability/assembly factor-like uncharacterized protein
MAMDPRRPETLYAASSYQGLFKTVDGGASWRRTSSARVVVVAVDPARSSTVYAATGEAGVLVSDDAGKSWRTVAAGLPRNYDAEIRALTVAQRTREVYAAVNIGDTAKGDTTGVYRLKRGGARWTRVVAGLPRNADGALTQLRSLASHPRTGAVCVGTNAGLYELVASGGKLRWRLVDAIFAGRTVRRVAFAPDASRLYAATPGRLLVSR